MSKVDKKRVNAKMFQKMAIRLAGAGLLLAFLISFSGIAKLVNAKINEEKEVTITVDEECQLRVNTKSKVKWSSRDKAVATVSGSGVITGRKVGTVKVIARYGTSSSVYQVKVKKSKFYVKKIPDSIFEKMKGKSYKDNCTVARKELRYVHVLHKNLEGKTLEGEIVCNRHIAVKIMEIFKKLYHAGYPIEKIRLVDEYDADDEKSMRDNNSSCFNFRLISHSTKVSKHGMGLAMDINTLYNPYVKTVGGKVYVEPETGKKYVDRAKKFDYKITKGDLAYELFTEAGFEWGGEWKSCKDYQHFEVGSGVLREWYAGD